MDKPLPGLPRVVSWSTCTGGSYEVDSRSCREGQRRKREVEDGVEGASLLRVQGRGPANNICQSPACDTLPYVCVIIDEWTARRECTLTELDQVLSSTQVRTLLKGKMLRGVMVSEGNFVILHLRSLPRSVCRPRRNRCERFPYIVLCS